jgi:hypothetical protein
MAFGSKKPDPPRQEPHMGDVKDEAEKTKQAAPAGQALERAQPGVPDYLAEAAEADAGRGVSTDAADNIVPLVYVMHPLSPQVDESSPSYVPGAKAGSIWLRNAETPMVDKDQGILVQPCAFWKDWVEWVPRDSGGGFVARFPVIAATAADVARFKKTLGEKLGSSLIEGEDIPDVGDATFVIDPANRQKKWSRPNGHDLILTRNHAVRCIMSPGVGLPYVIPMKGASHAVSKGWMGKFMVKRLNGKLLPSFACLYRLTTRQKKNTKGVWYQLEVDDAGYASAEDYREGRALADAFETGAKVAEAEVNAGDGVDQGGGSGDDKGGPDLPY